MEQALNPNYRRHHPKWYRRRIPIFWWLGKFSYTKFISRELTSLAVAYSALLLLAQIWRLSKGPEAYAEFLSWLSHPVVLVLNVIVLLVVLFHTISWLNLAPRALVLRLGGGRMPDWLVVAGHYAAWVSVSAALALLLTRWT